MYGAVRKFFRKFNFENCAEPLDWLALKAEKENLYTSLRPNWEQPAKMQN